LFFFTGLIALAIAIMQSLGGERLLLPLLMLFCCAISLM
jgi:hypothetical protein